MSRSVWIRGLASTAILAYLVSRIDMGAALVALIGVHPLHLATVLLLVGLDRLVMIGRWLLVLRGSGHRVAMKSVAWIFLVSSFVGSALPAGIGADAARAYTLSRRTDDPSEAVASVTIDRLAGILSLALLAAGGMLLWGAANTLPGGWVWLIATGTLTLALAVLFADRLGAPLIPASWRSSGPARAVMSLAHAVARYRDRRLTLAGVFALSVVVQLLRVWQAYLLGLGLGITVPFTYYLMFMPIGLLMLLLPISIAGFGLPQGAIVWLLRPQGVPDSLSFALSTLILLTGLAGNLPGAWLYARSKTQ